jgi:phosphoribosylamine--glycine ligase
VEQEVLVKAVTAMRDEGTPYRGVLYAGLMLTQEGPRVLEFNCRLGDPETQVLMPLLKTPIEDIAMAVAKGDLSELGPIEWSDRAAVGVVLASEAYPAPNSVPEQVRGLATVEEGVLVFHGGTKLRGASSLQAFEGRQAQPTVLGGLFRKKALQTTTTLQTDLLNPKITATGGRIFTVVATGSTVREAREIAYRNADRIDIDGVQYRRDIGIRELGDARRDEKETGKHEEQERTKSTGVLNHQDTKDTHSP